ncbi:hypothetical protein ACSBR2_033143 [Camellia fascicularis]
MYIAIDQEIEATHLIATEWWIVEARVKIYLNLESYEAVNHNLLIGPTRAMVNDRIRVRNIMEILDYCPLPDYPNSSSMKLLVWNCRGVGNKNEKRSFSTVQDHTKARKFQARLNRCKLMDLGCSGPRLTWTNGRQGLANTLERLYRAVCNTEWRLQFQEGEVRNLPRTYSDHSPLIVYTEGIINPIPLFRPFRMEAAWFTNPSFRSLVEESWTVADNSVLEAIPSITSKALFWNKNIFGNIFRNKRWLLGRIEGIQKAQSAKVSRAHFSSIFEKLQKRLMGWKASMLSVAGRATLIKSVNSALPAYMM